MSNTSGDLKSFHSFVLKLENGALNEDLSEAMRKCIKEISDACLDRGGSHTSTLTLSLKFKMDQKDKMLEVSADFAEKVPKAPRGRAGIFYADEHGNPLRENPRQLTLEDELARKRLENEERINA